MNRFAILSVIWAGFFLWAAAAWAGGVRGGFTGHRHFSPPGFSHSQRAGSHHQHHRFGAHHHSHHKRHFRSHQHHRSFAPFRQKRHFSRKRFSTPHHHHQEFGHPHQHFHSGVGHHHQHFHHDHFFGSHHGFHEFHSGFWGRSFSPAGPPALGAAGPPAVIISSPFFCFPHRQSFTDEVLFIDHLHRAHRLPSERALSFCRSVGGGTRLIFFGF